VAAALAYAARGWPVLPIHTTRDGLCSCGSPECSHPGKHPVGKLVPRGVKDSVADPDTIRRWCAEFPDANVGIATGAASGLVVLDVDPRHGGDTSLVALERYHGSLPDTPRVLTGGGGVHLYFAIHQPVGNRTGFAPGIDLRGDGGFVVAPPSLHASGRRYAWELGAGPDDVPLAPMPAWLLERICADRSSVTPRPPDEWAALVKGPIPAGARNDSLARLAGYLLRCRPAPHVVLELVRAVNQARCTPPLSDEEVVRTVDSIARREAERLMQHVDAGP
jgi:hypothetical protein